MSHVFGKLRKIPHSIMQYRICQLCGMSDIYGANRTCEGPSVHVIWYHVQVGDKVLEGIFTSREKAIGYLKDLKPKDPANYEIEEITLDKKS